MHPHRVGRTAGVVVRAFVRHSVACAVVDPASGEVWSMESLAPEGFYECFIPRRREVFPYQLRVTQDNGETRQRHDPYAFLPTLGEQDLHLFNEGNEHRIYDKLGAHLRTVNGVPGVSFAVWAPSARRVSVVGNFNGWDGRYHPMRPMGASGVWELFIPGLRAGEWYKFELVDVRGQVRLKTDPFGTYFEAPPGNAAIVHDPRRHVWSDAAWMQRRIQEAGDLDRPMSIYEVHLGSWRRRVEDANRPLTYRELAPALADYAVEMGFTHIEIMPIAEHPFEGSWGYQVTGFFAPTHRYGTPDDFAWFVDHLHQRGIGVILDWVPAHFPRDSFALAEFDGTHLYEHADPRQGAHMDWGTLIFNYSRNEVRCFLLANALAWLDRYHLDGLRVDAVASMLYLDYSRKEGEWVPNVYGGRENLDAIHFIKQCNEVCYQRHPGVMNIAEESTAWPGVSRPTFLGGLGYGFKWNMGWMNDTLSYMALDPIFRRYHHGNATFSLVYAFHEHFILVLSHDEVVHGKRSIVNKMPGDDWQKFANTRLLYAWMYAHPGKKLLFMGGEWGQRDEWSHERSLDWHLLEHAPHRGLRELVRHLNYLYKNEPALFDQDDTWESFDWIELHDADNCVLAFMRRARHGTVIVFVMNATPVARHGYRIGVPAPGWWQEILNTDSEAYGGGNIGNFGGVHSEPVPWGGRQQSVTLTLPPLAMIGLKIA